MASSAGARSNNFAFLRLLFASLVVVSHSPEILDGDRSRELLTRMFGTLSFGEVAVDGFFLLSGYLIAKSFAERPELAPFLARRLLRIVPAYLVCFWICVLIVAPLAGAGYLFPPPDVLKRGLALTLALQAPEAAGAFPTLPYHALNGAMWTIAYEVRCYLAVAAVGALCLAAGMSLAPGRRTLLVATALGLALNGAGALHGVRMPLGGIFGAPEENLRLFPIFGAGALFYLYRDVIALTGRGAGIAAALLAAALFYRRLAEPAVAIFGGYLIFWFALAYPALGVSLRGNRADISYGLYLYAMPLQALIASAAPGLGPWWLCAVALPAAAAAGLLSWRLVEKPANAVAAATFRGSAPPTRTGAWRPNGPLGCPR